jgi:hypothetical protein
MKTFLDQSNDRRLGADYAGPLLLWDIDKTYLETRFSSLQGLARIPFELAVDKRSVPGAVPLLRALRHGPGPTSAIVPLYFISGSPVQLRSVVERKMVLDGVDFDGITFKDQLGLALAGRLRDVKSQHGYKLKALLGYRRALPTGARWLMFGDDVESDAEIFLAFGELCRGLSPDELSERLERFRVHADDRRQLEALARELPTGRDPVERVFIHLTGDGPAERFTDPRVVATRSYLQTALVLAAEGRVGPEAIFAVAKDLRVRHLAEETIALHVEDAVARLRVPESLARLARGR